MAIQRCITLTLHHQGARAAPWQACSDHRYHRFSGQGGPRKLIRAVPDIGAIHLLIRGSKRHPDARSRSWKKLQPRRCLTVFAQDDRAFETFLEERIHCVTGEVTEAGFGIGQEDYRKLATELDAVINSAASVNFREELDKALAINTLCLRNIAGLVDLNPKLAVLQVSTCYVNGMNSGQVTESVIKPAGEAVPRSRTATMR